ncbi:MAG: response regulator transcription factor [Bacteroidota bacterium]
MMDYRSRMMDFRPRIVVIEPNDALRDGYSLILGSNKEYHVVNTYTHAEDVIKNIRRDYADVIFMDIELPGLDGINAIKRIRKLDPKVHIIVVTYKEDVQSIFEAFSAGTSGYLTKGGNHLELLQAVDEILNNGAPMSSKIAKIVVSSFQRSPDSPLSNRETEILSSLARGKTYKLTANSLHIGMETVKSHVKNIYSKLHVTTKSEAIEIARRHSLI